MCGAWLRMLSWLSWPGLTACLTAGTGLRPVPHPHRSATCASGAAAAACFLGNGYFDFVACRFPGVDPRLPARINTHT